MDEYSLPPYVSFPIPWDDSDPAEWGAQPSDPWYGEEELIPTGFSVQPVRAFRAPSVPKSIDLDALDGTPLSQYESLVLIAPATSTGTSSYQDTMVGIPQASYIGIPTPAPDLVLGGD
jgi:hypothetical protein